MKSKIFISLLLIPCFCFSQQTLNDGDWSAKYESLVNTPEAELMVRTGDIDNLGFGWPPDFNPFSGISTPAHAYPWIADEMDPSGTDRIMVISSYNGYPPFGQDGYTSGTLSPDNDVRPISVTFPVGLDIASAELLMFVDDFQAPVWGANYEVYLDGIRNNDLENIINGLIQTGPIGKMVTYTIPDNLLYLLSDGELEVEFDDYLTGAGDGYAIDFVKLLINPFNEQNSNAQINGKVTDFSTGYAIEGVVVSTSDNVKDTTDANGNYLLSNINPGIVQLNTTKDGYGQENAIVDIQENQALIVDFQLISPAPELIYHDPYDGESDVALNRKIKLLFNQDIDISTFNSSSFIFSDQQQNIPGDFTTSNDTLIFTPAFMEVDKNYTVSVTTNLKNVFGVGLAQDVVFYFDTGTGTTSTSEPSQLEIYVYPNPITNDYLQIQASEQASYYALFNIEGKLLQKGRLSKDLKLSFNIEKGSYYLFIEDEHHHIIYQEILIKN